MRILYAALDQQVPGALGGSVHVRAVAEGLARLGHDVHVATQVTTALDAAGRLAGSEATWHAIGPPFGSNKLRWMRAGTLAALARQMRADVVIERYYNFGGEGVLAARRVGVPAVLEVNAPIVDYPGSPKARLDRALVIEPLRRWRDRIARMTDLFVSPSAEILPDWIDRGRILTIEWGADVDRFQPGASGPVPFVRDPDRILCVFAGAFRPWHGADRLGAALARLHAAGDRRFGAVFIGDGPEREATELAVRGVPGVVFTGAIAHEHMPACLAAVDIGVAPFEPARHGPLQLAFYWSPLKVFEYMAAGLPVVAPALPRLSHLIENGREGLLYDPSDPGGLAQALVALVDRERREAIGSAARARVVRDYSWDAHCRALAARLQDLIGHRP